ncbi:MAG: HAD family hydrolase [Prevotella sp.]|nr:HAD family hydrolase [Prevotella sp.]
MIKAALFDLDGVIFDTEPQYTKFWGGQCRLYFPDRPGLENVIKGQTLVQIYNTVFADLKDQQPLMTERLNEFERQMSFDYIPGVVEFIESLRREGVRTAIVTSSNIPKMENVYRAHPEVKNLFDAILTSEDFTESKPHPQCYLVGAERVGVDPASCVGFEDSLNGLKSVKAAGMKVVGLATTLPKETVASIADVVIGDFSEIGFHDIKQLMLPSGEV